MDHGVGELVYDINLNYLGVRNQESGGKKGEKEEILEKSQDNFSIYLVLSVLSVLKFYL
ncbi:MAG: hypothetical protein F6K17_29535 [Okeania sp. SIO3C4]|nr:hypothetical protein [Okeania sp. SIO3C4]